MKSTAVSSPSMTEAVPENPSHAKTCPFCHHPVRAGELVCNSCGQLFAEGSETRKLRKTDLLANELSQRTRQAIGGAFAEALQPLVLEIDGQELTLPTQESVIIGRRSDDPNAPQPDVDLASFQAVENGVSRRHLLITRRRDLVYVTDLDAMNGTWLNRMRLTSQNERLLRDKDELCLGRLKMRVHFR